MWVFYYMANAMGRLIGTVLSGWVFQIYGIVACLWVVGGVSLFLAATLSLALPTHAARGKKSQRSLNAHNRITEAAALYLGIFVRNTDCDRANIF